MTTPDRPRVLVLFGGRSGEHEVSVTSARAVIDAVEALGYPAVPVGIALDGRWVRCDPRSGDRVRGDEPFTLTVGGGAVDTVDVAFPILHGPFGEDGTIQGLLEHVGLPFVGSGVAGSVIGIDKVLQKQVFAQVGLPVVDFVAFDRRAWTTDADEVLARVDRLGYPCFTKPVHLGSSVGISKVHDRTGFREAAERALRHDDDVIVEASGASRELEIGVLGDPPEVSVVGEIVPDGEFYDYRAKYRGSWTQLHIPADVPPTVEGRAAELAVAAFRAARCEGFARVDFFLDPAAETLTINEVNTIPGLTPASMFPKLWEASGLPFPRVVDRLVDHAFERHGARAALEDARSGAHDDEVGIR